MRRGKRRSSGRRTRGRKRSSDTSCTYVRCRVWRWCRGSPIRLSPVCCGAFPHHQENHRHSFDGEVRNIINSARPCLATQLATGRHNAPFAPLLEREKKPRRPETAACSGQPGGESREDTHGESRSILVGRRHHQRISYRQRKSDTFDSQNDGLALLAEKDSVIPNDKIRGMETRTTRYAAWRPSCNVSPIYSLD
ncbi:unnamed protein product [Pylaiella littoralis]